MCAFISLVKHNIIYVFESSSIYYNIDRMYCIGVDIIDRHDIYYRVCLSRIGNNDINTTCVPRYKRLILYHLTTLGNKGCTIISIYTDLMSDRQTDGLTDTEI